jgi:hypothetical protein
MGKGQWMRKERSGSLSSNTKLHQVRSSSARALCGLLEPSTIGNLVAHAGPYALQRSDDERACVCLRAPVAWFGLKAFSSDAWGALCAVAGAACPGAARGQGGACRGRTRPWCVIISMPFPFPQAALAFCLAGDPAILRRDHTAQPLSRLNPEPWQSNQLLPSSRAAGAPGARLHLATSGAIISRPWPEGRRTPNGPLLLVIEAVLTQAHTLTGLLWLEHHRAQLSEP